MNIQPPYQGSCHCGAIRFTVHTKIERVLSCNCSICQRAGYLLAFIPEAQFSLLAGADAMTDYQFGKQHIHHTFCRTCGVRAVGHGAAPDGGTIYAVNARCLEGIDLSAFPVDTYDGRSL